MPLPLILGAAKLVSALTGKGSAARAAKGAGKKAAGRVRREKDGVELEVDGEADGDGSGSDDG